MRVNAKNMNNEKTENGFHQAATVFLALIKMTKHCLFMIKKDGALIIRLRIILREYFEDEQSELIVTCARAAKPSV